MEPMVLTDPSLFPSEEVIFSHIGKAKTLWKALFEYIDAEHPEFGKEWRYYNDGKSWLLKVTRKKKTIFWLSVVKGSFRTTFYVMDRAEPEIMASALSAERKEGFVANKKQGKLAGITVVYTRKQDIEDAKALIGLKLALK